MKKYVRVLLVLFLAAGLFMTGTQKTVSAVGPPQFETSGVAEGSWVWTSASVPAVEVAMAGLPKSPYSWLQLLTNGLKIDGAAKICHPFKGGRFGWSGEIRQLVEGTWVKLATTNAWVPSTEGVFMSCTQAPAAGTYALFGSYTVPADYKLPLCSSIGRGSGLNLYYFADLGSTLEFGDIYGQIFATPDTYVRYQIVDANYPLTGDLVGSMTTNAGGWFDFHTVRWFGPDEPDLRFTIRVSTGACYFDWFFNGIA